MVDKDNPNCPNCQHPKPTNAVYCPSCGQQLHPTTTQRPALSPTPASTPAANQQRAKIQDFRLSAVWLAMIAIPMAIAVAEPQVLITVPIALINLLVSFRAHEKQKQSTDLEGPIATKMALTSNLITALAITVNSAIYIFRTFAGG